PVWPPTAESQRPEVPVAQDDSDLHLMSVHLVLKILWVVVIERTFGALCIGIHEVPQGSGGLGPELGIPSRVERDPVHFPGAEEPLAREFHPRIIQRQEPLLVFL